MLGFCGMLTATQSNENAQDKDCCGNNAPRSNCHDCGCNQLLFKANLSSCNIAIGSVPTTLQIETMVNGDMDTLFTSIAGGADFQTAFNGNDFSCNPIPHRCGIEIRPANGSSFTFSNPPVPLPGPVIGGLFDHVKFLAYSLFREAPQTDCDLCTTWIGSASQLQVESNPFDGAVTDPHADPRLACVSFASLDPNTLTTFDWIVTDKIIYALAERLPGGEAIFGNYAAYTYLIPVAHRKQRSDMLNDVHTFKTCYNRFNGTMTWELDGHKVFQISQIGHRLTENNAFIFKHGRKKPLIDPTRFQVLDHGGIDQDVSPIGIQSGLAFFTLLDFLPAQTCLKATENSIINSGNYVGLVRLESSLYRFGTTYFYNNPLLGGQQSFFADSALVGTQYQPTIPSVFRIFGQGAALRLFDYTMSLEN